MAIWKETVGGTVVPIRGWEIGDDALKLAIGFVQAWRAINGDHPPTSDKPNPPSPPTAAATASSEPDQALYKATKNVVFRGVVGSVYDVPESQRAIVEQQLNDLAARKQLVISCAYGPSNPQTQLGFVTYNFWYPSAPDDILKLLTSTFSHPFMEEGRAAVTACPATRAMAKEKYQGRMN